MTKMRTEATMLDAKQLAAIELAMLEEHRRDKEALERMKRFLRNGDNGQPQRTPVSLNPATFVDDDDDEPGNEGTIRKKVTEVFEADPERRWTTTQMVDHLKEIGFSLKAQKPESTLYGVFRRLHERGKIRLVRRGSGRNPHTYRLATGSSSERDTGATANENNSNNTLSPSSQKLISFLQSHGPARRAEIIEKSGIPAGTIANVLTRKTIFRQRPDGKWEAIPRPE